MKMHHFMRSYSRWLFLPLVLLIGACAPADDDGMVDDGEIQNVDDTMDAGTAVTASLDEYVRHYNLGHADAVAALYTEDGVGLYADGTVARGRAEIVAFNQAQMAGNPTVDINLLNEKAFGDKAVAVGEWSVDVTPEGAEPMQSAGHWMALYDDTDEGLKAMGVITNYDRQMGAEFLQGTMPAEPPPEESTMTEMLSAYEAAWNSGNAEAVVDMYADNVWAAFADLPPVTSKASLSTLMSERVQGNIDLHGVRSMDLGDGYTLDGGWYEISGIEGGDVRGNYWILVNTNDDGEPKIEWLVSNSRPVSVIPAAAAM